MDIMQLFWLFFVLPEFGVVLTPMTAAVLVTVLFKIIQIKTHKLSQRW